MLRLKYALLTRKAQICFIHIFQCLYISNASKRLISSPQILLKTLLIHNGVRHFIKTELLGLVVGHWGGATAIDPGRGCWALVHALIYRGVGQPAAGGQVDRGGGGGVQWYGTEGWRRLNSVRIVWKNKKIRLKNITFFLSQVSSFPKNFINPLICTRGQRNKCYSYFNSTIL